MLRFQVIDQYGVVSGLYLSPDLNSFLAQYNDGRWGQVGQFSVLQLPSDIEFVREQRAAAYPTYPEIMEAWLEHETESRSDKWAAIVAARADVKADFPKPAVGAPDQAVVVFPPPAPVVPDVPPVVSQPAPAAPVSAASIPDPAPQVEAVDPIATATPTSTATN